MGVDPERFVDESLLNPAQPDEMAFVLKSSDPDPEHGFSEEGYRTIARQIGRFLVGRSLVAYRRDGEFPKEMRATVKIDWIDPGEEFLEHGPRPWFRLEDTGETTTFEGSHRVPEPGDE